MKRGRGRPLKVATIGFPKFASMKDMAMKTGIPFPILKHAASNGCEFRDDHGRCDLGVFLPWFFAQDSEVEDGVDWGKREKRAKALLREVELSERKEEVIQFASVDSFLGELVGSLFFGELERMRQEFPASLKGKPEIEILEECERQIAAAKSNLTSALQGYLAPKKGGQEDE